MSFLTVKYYRFWICFDNSHVLASIKGRSSTLNIHSFIQLEFVIYVLWILLRTNFIFFLGPFYACIRYKFQDHFRYVRINSGCLSAVTDFLAFILPNIIVSFILDINKLRLTYNLAAVVWLFVLVMIICIYYDRLIFVQFWVFIKSSSLTIKQFIQLIIYCTVCDM